MWSSLALALASREDYRDWECIAKQKKRIKKLFKIISLLMFNRSANLELVPYWQRRWSSLALGRQVVKTTGKAKELTKYSKSYH